MILCPQKDVASCSLTSLTRYCTIQYVLALLWYVWTFGFVVYIDSIVLQPPQVRNGLIVVW